MAERKIRHLVETYKCWLHAKNLPKALSTEAMECAAYVINRVLLSLANNKAPYELLFGETKCEVSSTKGMKEWEAAVKEEMNALQKNQTWGLVLKPPNLFRANGYAKRLVKKFGLIAGKKRSTPLDVSTRLRRDEGTCLSDPHPFCALVGSLIYLTIIRLDIAFFVGVVS
ncbi:hypothetical protein ZIOFF_012267 [Zingiber officinale]|uniref:Reverse transcriptase n=1 Tax=Zingiber officinale TaxID=94328 RepID=A0A8J5I757_ZINOF|nr:hypothetical protein ZIOFF_012267 [Zingiber officinale]